MSEGHIYMGKFEDHWSPKVQELVMGYEEAYDYFIEDLFQRALFFEGRDNITMQEFDEIHEALDVGRKALGLSSVLETMEPADAFLEQRSGLIKAVYKVLKLERKFDNPDRIDFNPDKYDGMGWASRGF